MKTHVLQTDSYVHKYARISRASILLSLISGVRPGLIVWQSSHQPNWARQNFSPTKKLIPIYLLKKP